MTELIFALFTENTVLTPPVISEVVIPTGLTQVHEEEYVLQLKIIYRHDLYDPLQRLVST